MKLKCKRLYWGEALVMTKPKPKRAGWCGKMQRRLRAARFQGVIRFRPARKS